MYPLRFVGCSEVALANVESALGGAATQAPAPAAELAEKRARIARATSEVDEGARKKAEQARSLFGLLVFVLRAGWAAPCVCCLGVLGGRWRGGGGGASEEGA